MRRKIKKREAMPDELILAIGLVWGHLSVGQFEQAHHLARGCLRVWPNERRLILMDAYATVEMAETLDEMTLSVLRGARCREWVDLVLRRAEDRSDEVSGVEYMDEEELAYA